jgi:hypothetical protein
MIFSSGCALQYSITWCSTSRPFLKSAKCLWARPLYQPLYQEVAWAVLYLWLGALPAWAPAMLYSLEAITSFGHAQIYLADRWQLLGAIEAVNGLILFGLTTAFLFAAIQQVWVIWRD